MNPKTLDPRGRTGKRTSKTIRRFLSMAGLLPPRSTRAMDSHDPSEPCERIPVWDAKLGAFRDVDPDNLHDPLREPARQLASLRAALSHDDQSPRSAAPTDCAPHTAPAGDRLTDDPPRSPFGGGNRVALDGCDE